MFCAVNILYNIIPKIHIQNPSVLCVISHKNCGFRPFLLIFNRTWSKPVQAGCGCQLPIFRPKNQTRPDLQTLVKMCLNQFVCGLPNVPAFNSLRSDLPTHVASAGDQDLGAFISLTEKALELDAIFWSILPPSRVHSQLPSPTLGVAGVGETREGQTPQPIRVRVRVKQVQLAQQEQEAIA